MLGRAGCFAEHCHQQRCGLLSQENIHSFNLHAPEEAEYREVNNLPEATQLESGAQI